ncbi:venom serine protease 34 [Nomia melanderi]|uniref:venom serine protease 34 n=1 Tax=Nomia melanderi TaxID=2448451 RepID=UPI0013046372|nr:venom serine protease 34-like [Nomia melanderi]
MKGLFLALCWLTLLLGLSHAADPGCTYYQQLAPSNVYYIYNPNYPYSYSRGQSCLWTMKSDYKINVTCEVVLPQSFDCLADRLLVQTGDGQKHKYCGNGKFSLLSDGPDLSVELIAPFYTTGGRFLCEARAVKRPYDSENCECGRRNPSRIVGGTDAGVNEFPMMCALVNVQTYEPFCGCSIIHNKYVLTASHCIGKKNTSDILILVGEHDYKNGTETPFAAIYGIGKIIIHPDYNAKTRMNDITVLRLISDIKYNQAVGPVCLPFQHSPDTFGGDLVELLGWGAVEYAGEPSTTLQKVTLSVQTNLQCQKNYPGVSVNQLCTYAPDKDSCAMDSGGPVLWQNPTTENLVLTGIISYGIGCAVVGSVNTRVGAYIDWITSVTPDATYCVVE